MRILSKLLLLISRFYYYVFDRLIFYPLIRIVSSKLGINFMNLGYSPVAGEEALKSMSWADGSAGDRAHCELYERTLAKLPYYNAFEGKRLLEVGCGVGGGIRWIQKVHKEIEFIQGIDKCAPSTDNSAIIQGYAEALPFKSGSFDIVLNVESSHLYHNPQKFFAEAYRVLKPGGHLCWADLRRANKKEEPFAHAENAGLTLIEMQIINEQILRGAQITSAEYDEMLERAPYCIKILKNTIRATYCAPETKFYNKLRNYETFYWICLWKKPTKSH